MFPAHAGVILKRRAWDPEKREYIKVPANMTYKEWYGKFVAPESTSENSGIRIMRRGDEGLPLEMSLQFFAEKDIQRQSSASLKRGIRKLSKQINIHETKISDPISYIIGKRKFETLDPRSMKGLKS